jgi:predicted N-acyltransferase
MADYELSIAQGMDRIDRTAWDSLLHEGDAPLLSHGLLSLLEESGSICPETGWTPAHFLLSEKSDNGVEGSGRKLVAAAPFYVKGDSWGEFVFDMELASIAERAGIAWFPKLVGMVPATPAPGWRVLMAPTAPGEERLPGEAPVAAEADAAPDLTRILLEGAEEAARQNGLAGIHVLWPHPSITGELRTLRSGKRTGSADFVEWSHQAFLWEDRGYGDFGGWLGSFSKNMRRNVLRERAALRAAGVESRIVGAEEATRDPKLLPLMSELYVSHNDKFGPWAARFLTEDFFLRLPEFLPGGWCLSVGYEGGEPVAMAFLFEGKGRLYGRYYGARREIPFLHFELCYYRPLEYALDRGIPSFDPGMGSPHKARRGFASYSAPSFHRVFDPRMASFLAEAMPEVNRQEAEGIEALNGDLPYK